MVETVFESRTGYTDKSLQMRESEPGAVSPGHRKGHRVIRTSTLVFALILGLALYPTEGRTHTGVGSHPVQNWHRWINVARCETDGVTKRWTYGPSHPYAKANGWSGYRGGLQFNQDFWDRARARFKGRTRKYRTVRYANNAPRWVQIRAAENHRRNHGTGAWPHCGRRFYA